MDLDAYGCALMEAVTDGFYNGTIVDCIEHDVFQGDNDKALYLAFDAAELRPNSVSYIGTDISDVHWVFVDSDNIIHNSYEYNMQRANSHQFCQAYALHMALYSDARQKVADPLQYMRRVASEIWEPYLCSSPRHWRRVRRYIKHFGAAFIPRTVSEFMSIIASEQALRYYASW